MAPEQIQNCDNVDATMRELRARLVMQRWQLRQLGALDASVHAEPRNR